MREHYPQLMIASRPCISTRRLLSSWEISLVKDEMTWSKARLAPVTTGHDGEANKPNRSSMDQSSAAWRRPPFSSGTGAAAADARPSRTPSPRCSVSVSQRRQVWGWLMAGTAEKRAAKGQPGHHHHHYKYLCLLLEAFLSGVLVRVLPSWNCTIGLEQASEFSSPISVLPSNRLYGPAVTKLCTCMIALKYWRVGKNQPGGISFTVHKYYSFQKASSLG